MTIVMTVSLRDCYVAPGLHRPGWAADFNASACGSATLAHARVESASIARSYAGRRGEGMAIVRADDKAGTEGACRYLGIAVPRRTTCSAGTDSH
jgi:hypothetical protein